MNLAALTIESGFDRRFVRAIWRHVQHEEAPGTCSAGNPRRSIACPCRNGDLNGCRVTVRLSSVEYTVKDIGKRWKLGVEVNTQRTDIAEHDLVAGTTTAENPQVCDRLEGACPADIELAFSTTPYIIDTDGTPLPYQTNTDLTVPCPTVVSRFTLIASCPVDKGGADTVLKVTYEITARCL